MEDPTITTHLCMATPETYYSNSNRTPPALTTTYWSMALGPFLLFAQPLQIGLPGNLLLDAFLQHLAVRFTHFVLQHGLNNNGQKDQCIKLSFNESEIVCVIQ